MTYSPYQHMKPSGVPWIGDTPQHWQPKKVTWAFGKIGSGTTPPSGDESYYDGETPWVNTGELNDCLISSTSKTVSNKAVETFSALSIYPPGTLLIALYGATIGKLGVLNISAATNQACCALGKPDRVNVWFLFYWFLGNRPHIVALAYGGGQPNISQETIKQLRFFVPSLEEQQAIVAFLDRKTAALDALIRDKERQIALLGEQRQALISHAVTRGLNPNAPLRPSGIAWLGDVPQHWQTKKIKYLAKINALTLSEQTDADRSILYIDIGSVDTHGSINSLEETVFEEAPSRARRIVSSGDTLVSTVRTYLKAIAFVVNAEPELICSTGFAVLTAEASIVPKYLFYWARSNQFVDQVVSRSTGVSYPAINALEIGDIEMPLFGVEEQRAIVAYIDEQTKRIDDITQAVQEQINKLRAYRQALISEAVTGKIDVRGESG